MDSDGNWKEGCQSKVLERLSEKGLLEEGQGLVVAWLVIYCHV